MDTLLQPNASAAYFAAAQKVIPGGVNSPVRAFRSVGGSPFFTVEADGAYLTTAEGGRLIDYVSTWGPAILGHNHPAPREAIAAALPKGVSFGTPNPHEVEMAELITTLLPSIERVRMVNSGTEACMSCLRLARGFTGRSKVVKFAGCYHGHVDALLVEAGSGALTFGQPSSAGIPLGATQDTLILTYNDSAAVEAVFAQMGDEIAAVILEPYAGNCGFIPAGRDFLQTLRTLCTTHGSVLIFDEVMTGFRVALGGVQAREEITPDLSALGKIIGGGLPVGAFGGRAEIMSQLAPDGPVYQAGTLSGNPLAMVAGLAQLRTLQTLNPYPALEKTARVLAEGLLDAARSKGIPLQAPYTSGMLSVFFSDQPVQNLHDVQNSEIALFKRFFQHALKGGVYCPPSAYEAWFPGAAHTPEIIAQSLDVLTQALHAL